MIKRRLGDGVSTRFWYDNWSPFGQLDSFLKPASSRLGIAKNASLASLYQGGNWLIPPARSETQLLLRIHLTTLSLTTDADFYEWEMEGKVLESYSMGSMYTFLCGDRASVSWAKVVWSSFGIPRHDFLAWLTVLNRCPTRDRLLSWGLTVSPLCLLCNSASESRDYLYFICPYSHSLWSSIARRCNLVAHHSWEDTLTQMQGLSSSRPIMRLTLIAVKATIYWLWSERNSRLHRATFKGKESLLLTIDRQIRNRISSLRVSHPATSSAMMQHWLATPQASVILLYSNKLFPLPQTLSPS